MNAVDKEQLAAEVIAVLDAHLGRPDVAVKKKILGLAAQQMLKSLLVLVVVTRHVGS